MKRLVTLARYGRLTVVSEIGAKGGHIILRCRCDCGAITDQRRTHLASGAVRSCGCLASELTGNRNRTHGHTNSVEWVAWMQMRGRCQNPRNRAFKYYGGRGIKVCDRWQTFQHFFADIGRRPSAKHSLDRINVNGNYEPGNCRWATKLEQARNTRANVLNPELAAHIRALAATGMKKIAISRQLGIGYGSVKYVAAGRQWA